MRYLASGLLTALAVFIALPAYGEEPAVAAVAAVPTAPTAPPPSPDTGSWGWIVVGTGLVAGGSLTTYGLFIECSEENLSCMKGASTAIWGGIGIASLASVIGIAIVQSGRARARSPVTVSVDASPRPGLVLRGSF